MMDFLVLALNTLLELFASALPILGAKGIRPEGQV